MKRSQFRLATVLRVRLVQENLAAGLLAGAQREATEARRREGISNTRYRAAAATALREPDADSFLAWRHRGERYAAALMGAQEQLAQAAITVDTSHDHWAVAARRVSGLERLEQRHRDDHHLAVQHDDVAIADEQSSQRHELLRQSRSADRPPAPSPSHPEYP